MVPPMVSFIAWNRMGLTARNLAALLDTEDDFELHIIDNNSQDDTWEYIHSLKDSRIVSRVRFSTNQGPIHAVNFNLAKRRKDQFFITVDNDVNIHTTSWVSNFIRAFEAFPEVGLLGAVSREYYRRYKLPLLLRQNEDVCYLQVKKGFVEGCCQCLRPELLNRLGYWNEENCMGDMEMCCRIAHYTPYTMGFLPSIEIDQEQSIDCQACTARNVCKLDRTAESCFSIRNKKYRNIQFRNTYGWKYEKYLSDMKQGKEVAFCASIHDEASMKACRYDRQMAEENFRFYRDYAN